MAQFLSLVADELTNSSNGEKLAIVQRCADPDDLQIREDLVQFVEFDARVTGSVLWQRKSLDSLTQVICIPTSFMDKRKFDGASNMTGRIRGAAAIITSIYSLALYLYCSSHSLNLAVKSLEVQSVQNMIGVIKKVTLFFHAHPKHQRKHEKQDTTTPTSSVHKLKDLCRTRWVERIDAVQRFKDLFCSILSCFESISVEGHHSWSSDSLTDSSTLLLAITTTDFSSTLVITSHNLSILKQLTKSLQAESEEIVEAVWEIDNLKKID